MIANIGTISLIVTGAAFMSRAITVARTTMTDEVAPTQARQAASPVAADKAQVRLVVSTMVLDLCIAPLSRQAANPVAVEKAQVRLVASPVAVDKAQAQRAVSLMV